MPRGFFGADSSSPVTTELVQTAAALFGQPPPFWGRYFTSVTTGGQVEYRHAEESPVLAQNKIRLLPVARQTTNVAGNQQQGAADASANVTDLLATFPQDYLASEGGQFLIFLDVEGTTESPSLGADYYTGWAQTLISQSRKLTNNSVTILPCVYARQGDDATWEVLVAANQQSIPCYGAWVARYYYNSCSPSDWDDAVVLPSVKLPFPVLLWQYAENCCNGMIDSNQTNPGVDIQSELLNRLILPTV